MGKQSSEEHSGNVATEGTGSGGAKSTSTTETKSRGRGRTGSGGRGQQAEEEKLPRLVPVDVPGNPELSDEEKKKEEKREKDRIRKANSRANAKSSPRSRGKAKSAPSMELLQLKPILLTMSQLVASREGFEVWALKENEIDMLCEPIGNMLAKTSALEKVGENSDAIALAIACFTIFVPKFLMWNATRKQKGKVVENYAKPIQTTGNTGRNQTGATRASSGPSVRESTASGQTFGGQLNSLIPASNPF